MTSHTPLALISFYDAVGSSADSSAATALANLIHSSGLVVNMAADYSLWNSYISTLDATASARWLKVLREHSVEMMPNIARCNCEMHTELSLRFDDAASHPFCTRPGSTARELAANSAWTDSSNLTRKYLRPSESFPDSWRRRFKVFTECAEGITIADPYLASDTARNIGYYSGRQNSVLAEILDTVGPSWKGSLRIAIKMASLQGQQMNGLDFIEGEIRQLHPHRSYSYHIVGVPRSSKILHDRTIGFNLGRAQIDFEVGKGLQVFGDPQPRSRSTCTLTEPGLSADLFSDALQHPAKVERHG